MGGWDQDGSYGNLLGRCGVDSPGSGRGLLEGCCEHSDELSGSGIMEFISYGVILDFRQNL
jgi:hypothetical protein